MLRYQQQTVLLASKHRKEQAIAAPLKNILHCDLSVKDFDTDQFGTFTGEIARREGPYETCLAKAREAGERFGYNLVLASEGSFGPHPAFPFMAGAHEIMVFIDQAQDWIITEHLISQNTNYSQLMIHSDSVFDDFLLKIGFPDHAVCVQSVTSNRIYDKGIQSLPALREALKQGFAEEAELRLLTDMRAMMNPTRMEVLHQLAKKLARRVANACPSCQAPGFGFIETRGQLPCRTCQGPTSMYAQHVWGCIQCEHEIHYPREDGSIQGDPGYCYFCNP